MGRYRAPTYRHGLFLVVAVGAFARLYGLSRESLWTDELITVEFIRRYSPLELLVEIPLNQPHLPLYYVSLDLWTGVVGGSAGSMRLLSALFGILAIPLVYLVGRDLFDSAAGLVSALVFALSGFHVYHAQEVRMYSLLALLSLLSLWLFVRLLDAPTRRAGVAYVLATVALLATHPFAALVVFAQGCYVALRYATDQPVPRPLFAGFGVLALAFAPMAAGLLYRLGGSTSTPFPYIPSPTPSLVASVFLEFFAQTSITAARLFVGCLVGGCLALALTDGCVAKALSRDPRKAVRGLRSRLSFASDRGVELLVVWLAATFVVPIVASLVLFPVFWPRYVLPASLGFYLLVGRGVTRLKRPQLRVLVVCLLLVALVPPTAYGLTTDSHEQWDEATADVEAAAAPNAQVVVADQITERGFEYYRTRSDLSVDGVVVEGSGTGRPPTSDQAVRALVEGDDEVWLVLSHTDEESERRLRALVGEGRVEKAHRTYVGIEVYRYEQEVEA